MSNFKQMDILIDEEIDLFKNNEEYYKRCNTSLRGYTGEIDLLIEKLNQLKFKFNEKKNILTLESFKNETNEKDISAMKIFFKNVDIDKVSIETTELGGSILNLLVLTSKSLVKYLFIVDMNENGSVFLPEDDNSIIFESKTDLEDFLFEHFSMSEDEIDSLENQGSDTAKELDDLLVKYYKKLI